MAIKRIKFEDIEKSQGSTDKNVIDKMTEADIKRGILSDIDSPNLTDKELDEFKSISESVEKEKIKLQDVKNSRGSTNWNELKKQTDTDIEKVAKSSEAKLLTNIELSQFRRSK
ncbi:hypothetical protein MAH1_18820 [Sessilibacter sp. MAH1]